jgi:hypothetical protein
VGGKLVTAKRYQGRSGCCSGLDQIIFDLPSDTPVGCYVPIQVIAGGSIVSNSATIAVSGSGTACSDEFNPISERFRQGGRLGLVTASRTSVVYNYVTFQREVTTESATATFRRVQASPYFFDPQISLPPLGTCTVHTARGDLLGGDDLPGFVNPAAELNAGAEVRIGSSAVPRIEATRFYSGSVASSAEALGLPATVLSSPTLVTGPGGADVGTLQFTLQPPGPIAFTNRADLEVVDRTKGFTVNWQGGDTDRDVILVMGVGVNLPENSSAQFICTASPTPASFTVPARILQSMPLLRQPFAVDGAFTFVFVGRTPLRAPQAFDAAGADASFALTSQWAGKAVLIP